MFDNCIVCISFYVLITFVYFQIALTVAPNVQMNYEKLTVKNGKSFSSLRVRD